MPGRRRAFDQTWGRGSPHRILERTRSKGGEFKQPSPGQLCEEPLGLARHADDRIEPGLATHHQEEEYTKRIRTIA